MNDNLERHIILNKWIQEAIMDYMDGTDNSSLKKVANRIIRKVQKDKEIKKFRPKFVI